MNRELLFYITAILLCAGILSCNKKEAIATCNYEVVPLPKSITPAKEAPFILSTSTHIGYPEGNEKLRQTAVFLSGYIREMTGIETEVTADTGSSNSIRLVLDRTAVSSPEGYRLKVGKRDITITGSSEAGIFYGIQTLRKSLPVTGQKEISFPAVQILDEPEYRYRGMHLDVGRHFFSTDFIKKYIDIIALHNLNTFHWHLTDDQGWRIEIKKYPKLTEIGSKRKESLLNDGPGKFDGKPYGGFYTQEEVKDIIEYAAERYITVIPEIDLPGHITSALAAYPDLGCTGGPYEVATTYGVHKEVLCVGNEQSLRFAKDVLSEIIELFPSHYIHVGGDECPRDRWQQCPKCQALIHNNGWKDTKEHKAEDKLQSYFMTEVERFVNSKGRQIIGWDEILEGGLAPNATVMSWRGTENGIKAAEMQHDVIMTPAGITYFSGRQLLELGGNRGVRRVYDFKICPDTLSEAAAKHIIGVQGNIWTEYMPGNDNRDYQAFPRAVAIAETGWTLNANKNWNNFCQRMVEDFRRMDVKNVKACRNFFDVNINTHVDETNTLKVVLESFYPNAEIHYTTNGSVPTVESAIYNQPFALSGEMDVKAAAFKDGKMLGKVSGKKLYGNLISGKSFTVTPPIGAAKGDIFGENDVLGTDISTFGLTNGKRGNIASMTPWSGFRMNDACNKLVFIVEFEQPTTVSKVVFGSLYNPASVILPPSVATVETSSDGRKYDKMAEASFKRNYPERGRKAFTDTLGFAPKEVKYIKITLQNGGTLRNGIDFVKDPNEKDVVQANIYLDEIEVY